MNFKKWFVGISLIILSSFNIFSISLAETTAENTNKTPVTNSSNTLSKEDKTLADIAFFQTIGQSLYAATWPLMVISGIFLNNSVIYGTFLGLDTQLWKLWNIFRTFANYIIGFLLIFSIFSLFLGGKFEKFNPIKLLPQLAIGALLVNLSWFLIGVCIDFSNILTYAIGQLPLKVAPTAIQDAYKKTQKVKVGIKFQNDNNGFLIGVVDKKKIVPFCSFTAIGDEFVAKINNSFDQESKQECAYLCKDNYYKLKVGTKIKLGECAGSKIIFSEKNTNISGKLMGPFYSIYGGLLNVGRLVTFSNGSVGAQTFEILFKLIFLLALTIPLFVLAIILVVRVVFIWMYIVISPFIFLFSAVKNFGGKFLGEKGKLSNMCCVIFMPVFVTFALSLSVIFLSAINFKTAEDKGFLQYLGIQVEKENPNCIILKPLGEVSNDWDIKMCAKLNGNSVVDTNFSAFDVFILSIVKWLFGIGFMWIVVFTALKSCKLTEKIAASVQGFAQNMLKAAPIFPVAGGQSIGSLTQGLNALKSKPGQWQEEQFDKTIQPWLNELQRRASGIEEKYIKAANSSVNKVSAVSFNPLNILEQISKSKNTDIKNILNTKYIQLKKSQKEYLANNLGVSVLQLDELISKLKLSDKKVENILKNDSLKGKLTKELRKKYLKDFINTKVLSKEITLLQLSDKAKESLINILQSIGYNVSEISRNKELVKALSDLGFKRKEIIKLIADNLEGSDVSFDKKKEIEEFIIESLGNEQQNKNK